MNHCIGWQSGGPLVDLARTAISPVSLTTMLCDADETMHVKATDCSSRLMSTMCCLPASLLLPLFTLTHSQTLFSVANPVLKKGPPVLLIHAAASPLFFVHAVPSVKKALPTSSCALLAPLDPLGLALNIPSPRKPSLILSNGNHSRTPPSTRPKLSKCSSSRLPYHHAHLCIVICPHLPSITFLYSVHLLSIICALFVNRRRVSFS